MFFSVFTLGCKLNQLESEAIADSFRLEGFELIPWDRLRSKSKESFKPLLMLVNTCTVTSMAEQKARRIIRKALNEHPGACLIVTGCYAQMDKDALSALEEGRRLFVIPGGMKDRLLDLPRFLVQAFPTEELSSKLQGEVSGIQDMPGLIASWLASSYSLARCSDVIDGTFRFCPEEFSSHSRAFLKIQDGCDHHCSYCRVSLARGTSRSLSAKNVLAQLLSLEQRGFAEAVLTGVNIFQYRDSGLFPGQTSELKSAQNYSLGLPGLLSFLLNETGKIRLRLSSIELENELHKDLEDFINVIANNRIRSHFHLSMQSGSAKILAKMGRQYGPEDIERAAASLRLARGDPFLACDIIAGFPGETERDFEDTLKLCEKIGFAWIHAFPFSPRPGTAASGFPEKVSEKDKARRVRLLTELAKKGRLDYIHRWQGKEVEAVVEAGGDLEGSHKPPGVGTSNLVKAVSENYLKLLVKCDEKPVPGSIIRCIIQPFTNGPSKNAGNFDALAERI